MFFSRAKLHAILLLVVTFVAFGAGLGCDSPKSKGVKIDGGGDGDSRGDGDSASGELPGGYRPTIQCGDLGNTCSPEHPCPEDLACQGGMCLPDLDDKNVASCTHDSCPLSAPICVIGACVSVEQLACICLNPGGRELAHQCASILPDGEGGGACTHLNGLCDNSPESCCAGLSCLRGKDGNGEPGLGLCREACDQNDECDSGCCAQADGIAGKFCTDFSECLNECRREDEECDGQFNPCCEGLVCAQSTADLGLNGCKLPCQKNSACETGCCVLFHNADGSMSDDGVCAPADRCATP